MSKNQSEYPYIDDKKEYHKRKKEYQRAMGSVLKEERNKRRVSQERVVDIFFPLIPNQSVYSRYEKGETGIPHILVAEIYKKWGVWLYPDRKSDENQIM